MSIAPATWTTLAVTVTCWLLLFAQALRIIIIDWVTKSEAAHGGVLAIVALVLAWRAGATPVVKRGRAAGLALLAASVLLRVSAGLAAERYTIELSMLLSLLALTVFYRGWAQVRRWWLPFSVIFLSVPLPELLIGTLTLPLQLSASHVGAWLLEARHVPATLAGNVIRLPGHDLFVAEACSGLRSLTALISLGLLLGGVTLRHPISRSGLLIAVIPIAIALNGFRVFTTGFTVYFLGPSAARGFLHFTEGWLVFLLAIVLLGALAQGTRRLERWAQPSYAR